jgi:hypothetical protein
MPTRFAAQVLLTPAADAARAQNAFAALGFTLGAQVGGNFAVEADAAVFSAVFGVQLKPSHGGGVAVRDASGPLPGNQLPLQALPATLQGLVAAVLFTEPPEFGPGSFA